MKHQESELQRNCVTWFRLTHPKLAKLLFAVPNGGRRSKVEACIMKAEGTMAGVADLLLLVPSGRKHGLCIEMKTATGKQSQSQKDWERAVTEQGYGYMVCRSFDDFRSTVSEYLNEKCHS